MPRSDNGINLIDTAPVYGYGHSEQVVGRAIHDRRDRVVLATKCGLIWDREEGTMFFYADDKGATLRPPIRRPIKRFTRTSARRRSARRSSGACGICGTDRIDLLQTHWQDPSTPLAETVAELQRLKKEGKIRAIGVSNCNLEHLKAYGPSTPIKRNSASWTANWRKTESSPGAARTMFPCWPTRPCPTACLPASCIPSATTSRAICGRRTLDFTPDNVARINGLLKQLEPMAQRYSATIGQLVIAWTAAQPGITCVLCGARDSHQAIENAAAGSIELSARGSQDDRRIIPRVNRERNGHVCEVHRLLAEDCGVRLRDQRNRVDRLQQPVPSSRHHLNSLSSHVLSRHSAFSWNF